MAEAPILQLSLTLPSFTAEAPASWDFVLDHARLLDEAGVDRLLVSDHVVFGERLEEYGRPEIGGQAGGRQPTGPDGHWLEPLTTLAVAAGATSRIRLRTNILLAALRRPVVLAKSAATLDVLSRGRLDLGVGIGWQKEEYEAAGLDFGRRGTLLDETLAVCQALWTQERAAYESERLSFTAIHMMPKPAQPGGVPIWVSGTVNPRVIQRLARFGSGWIPWGDAARDLPASIKKMKDALADAGRDPAGLQVAGLLKAARGANGQVDVAATMDAVPGLAAAGVTEFRPAVVIPDDRVAAEDFLDELVVAFRTAAAANDGLRVAGSRDRGRQLQQAAEASVAYLPDPALVDGLALLVAKHRGTAEQQVPRDRGRRARRDADGGDLRGGQLRLGVRGLGLERRLEGRAVLQEGYLRRDRGRRVEERHPVRRDRLRGPRQARRHARGRASR